ncbi:MAG: 50S ribosomal protein L1 [Candidatus Berkelbacteria bacterium]|nr:MAG: 50S ribosomal protein L1 [Candidatus Berkelbacteria bacterium]QQG51441.1 MAG: 50S ribosomal protein L1 [Candidatus Berkelbacteria bacterium]
MPKKNTKTVQDDNPVELEKDSEREAEGLSRHHSEASIDEAASSPDEEAEKGLAAEEGADVDADIPAEIAAINTDNEIAKELNEPATKKGAKKTESKKVVSKKAKLRSKKYHQAKNQVEAGKRYPLDEAVTLVKKVSLSKFDGSIEVHLKLIKKKGKVVSESPKGLFHLPHGSGKQKNIIVLDENKIEEIAKTKRIDFDIALASPELMPKVGKIAKILGPKGKMPDPKSGTVTNDPKKTIEEINAGKVEYRIDAQNQVHQIVGKVSWDDAKLLENIRAIFATLPKSRIETAHLSASISPSVSIDLNSL